MRFLFIQVQRNLFVERDEKCPVKSFSGQRDVILRKKGRSYFKWYVWSPYSLRELEASFFSAVYYTQSLEIISVFDVYRLI